MKAYLVAVGAALILFSIAGIMFLVGVESEADGSFDSDGVDVVSGGSPVGNGDGDRGTGDPRPGRIELDPGLDGEVKALLGGVHSNVFGFVRRH